MPLGPFRIFLKIRKLPPVSTTPAANFATSFTGVNDTGGKQFKQGEQYQPADTLK
jgi:hypothetical protein